MRMTHFIHADSSYTHGHTGSCLRQVRGQKELTEALY